MARDNRIGPYMTYRNPYNREGLVRRTGGELWPNDVFKIANELSSIPPTASLGKARNLEAEFKEVVMGEGRPFDRAVRDLLLYTEREFYIKNHHRWHPTYPHRVLVRCRLTSKNNLSVTLSPECLSADGQWAKAPEWREDPFQAYPGFRERPTNEVLFLRDVAHLFAPAAGRWEDETVRDVQCRAVLSAFWLVMRRLEVTFELHYANDLVGLSTEPRSWDEEAGSVLGLEIVDTLPEYRKFLEHEIASFEREVGYPADYFLSVCQDASNSSSEVSRRLRQDARGTLDLTPAVVRDLMDFLTLVTAYQIWMPPDRGRPQGADPSIRT